MKTLRLLERLEIIREHLFSHVTIREDLARIDDKLLLILDHKLDIRKLHPATGRLRLRQEVCFQILRILNRIANRNRISIWLDFGTLLGAVRHEGFVPWDDDLDVSMLKTDYDRLKDVLTKQLPHGLILIQKHMPDGQDIGIMRVLEEQTECYVDIYPYEIFTKALNKSGISTKWFRDWQEMYSRVFQKGTQNGFSEKLEREISDWAESHRVGDGDSDAIAPAMIHFSAAPSYRKAFRKEDIFPLGTAIFEGEPFHVAHSPDAVLSLFYGDYLKFPPDAGHAAHGGSGLQSPDASQLRRAIDQLNAIVRNLDSK